MGGIVACFVSGSWVQLLSLGSFLSCSRIEGYVFSLLQESCSYTEFRLTPFPP